MQNLRAYIVAIVIPVAIVGALHLNNMLYYDLKLGYDMPLHLKNTLTLIETGSMPPPPLTHQAYQAHQPPIFYQLSALFTRFADYGVHFKLVQLGSLPK